MCTTCFVNPFFYGEVLPGFFLIRARRQYFDEMYPKEWGLVVCNGPSLIWKTTPYLYDDENLLDKAMDAFQDEFYCTPELGYMIISSFKEVYCTFRMKRLFVKYGQFYKRRILAQLYIYMADYIANSIPEIDVDQFPDNDKCFEHNYEFDPKEP
jgi:hypothetical protein